MAKVFPDGWRELSATRACCAAKRRWWNSPASRTSSGNCWRSSAPPALRRPGTIPRPLPFWHLRTDGVWQLAGPAEITSRPAGATPTITELRRGRVAGGFAEPVRLALAHDPALIAEIARRILNAHFPESIRQDVADAVGLSLDAENTATPEQAQRRDAFASKLAPTAAAAASAGTTCALAATNGWQRPGLEAAHIKWFQARGPDVVPNGLALCSLHHKIFDLGAFTVLPGNHQIVFSRHLMGGDDTKAKLLAHHGAGLIEPQGRECLPQPEFLTWHRAEVFKEPARE